MANVLDAEHNPQIATNVEVIASGLPGWGAAFRELRKMAGLGQKTIARRMGIHATTLTKWEHGRSQPSRETRLRALAVIGWT